jgi:DNA primase
MRIPPSFLDELRARLPVSEVVGRRVKLRKAGREFKGISPFNKEKTPSFFVNDQKQAWFDFSSGKNGSIFDFVMMTEGISFPEAVEKLAAMAGMALPAASPESDAREIARKTLYEVLEVATKFFEGQLASQPGAKARGYLADRGILPSTQLEFRFGYAPAQRFALKEHLGKQGIPVADMIAAGLLIAGDDIPVPYDRFRDRVIIPIHDQRGRVIAFGGRTLSKDVQPKYLNSPETEIFHKGAMVFNFHRARQPAHEDRSVVVVEGYMDAISIFQAGMKSVVASMGTAFTEEQIATLWRLSAEPVVCFDADNAGISAAYRSIDRILPELKVGRTFRFAFLQDKKDPDELIRDQGLEAFKSVLAGSLPLWDVLWERETGNLNVETPDAQAALEFKLKSIVGTIKDPQVHTAYERTSRMQLANLFWQTLKARRSDPKASGFERNEIKKTGEDGRRSGLQKILLGLLVHYPDFVDEKADVITSLRFSTRLEEFRKGLYDLLIMNGELSVQLIYEQLKPVFYEVLQDIHGEATPKQPLGHRLFLRFPLVKLDPPREFISRCIDHFANMLSIDELKEEIDQLSRLPASEVTDESVTRIFLLMGEWQQRSQLADATDRTLDDEARDMRRVWVASSGLLMAPAA